jgi:CIC family chloride channel protein
VPPRDLRSWQNLPISAVANFNPTVINGETEASYREFLMKHPYRYFPIVREDRVEGVVSRNELETAVAEGRPPRLDPVVTCRPGDSIRECQTKIIQSNTGTLVVIDESKSKMLAFVTLHDLLRAQLAVAEREGSSP